MQMINRQKKFIKYIAQSIRADVKTALHASPFLSTITDGSTDVGTIEQEIVYTRYLNLETFTPDTRFIALKSVSKADAEHLLEALSSGDCRCYI
jgi:hypothetical protein